MDVKIVVNKLFSASNLGEKLLNQLQVAIDLNIRMHFEELERQKMLTSVEGIYRNGRVELVESPTDVVEGARVIVTFVPSNSIDLASQGIDKAQAEVLRTSLGTFAEDWTNPQMSIYDDYDTAKANL